MTIDILSDLHLDFYLRKNKSGAKAVEAIYVHIFTDNQKKMLGMF